MLNRMLSYSMVQVCQNAQFHQPWTKPSSVAHWTLLLLWCFILALDCHWPPVLHLFAGAPPALTLTARSIQSLLFAGNFIFKTTV